MHNAINLQQAGCIPGSSRGAQIYAQEPISSMSNIKKGMTFTNPKKSKMKTEQVSDSC